MKILESLNPEQREAVINTDGPVLVLAGAGSGKTRVLTHKVAYLLGKKLAQPGEIMAVTFTNKAAGEMRERIEKLVGGEPQNMWVGTFHALFARVMRRFGDRMGYSPNFAIYDREDQERLMKEVLNSLSVEVGAKSYKRAVRKVSDLKSKLKSPSPKSGLLDFGVDLQTLYRAYESKMKAYNALDFDDLLVKPLELMRKNRDIADLMKERFRYILVDEFQDTNIAQNELIKLLCSKHRNLTVVGDDDQSIYGWRGAELENILNFERDYPGAKVFRLERNYRSTDLILQAAQAVIDNNLSRHPKTLWTKKKSAVKPFLSRIFDAREEAVSVVSTIKELIESGLKPSDIAVLYRINALSRTIESALREYNLPYTIVGGLKFYQRKEIKDLLAYLKLTINTADGISLTRIINFPTRGIGATTVKRLSDYALKNGIDLWEALSHVEEIEEIKASAVKKLNKFHDLIKELRLEGERKSFPELVKSILEKTGMTNYHLQDGSEEAFARIDNLREFQVGVEEYSRANPERRLDDFLQEVALVSDVDEWEKGDLVSLMTLHSAKGLEFPVVFIIGLDDGLFPLIRDGEVDLEEERRLFYVGATRAKDRLYFSCAASRQWGMVSIPSRFLEEIPEEMLEFQRKSIGNDLLTPLETSHEVSPVSTKERVSSSTLPASDGVALFKRGDMVVHDKFGEGTVSASEGVGDNEKVMVYFQGYGAKKLLVKFAGLRKSTP